MRRQFADIAAEEEAACREYVAELEARYPEQEQVVPEVDRGDDLNKTTVSGIRGGGETTTSIKERSLINEVPLFWIGVGGIAVITPSILAKKWLPVRSEVSSFKFVFSVI